MYIHVCAWGRQSVAGHPIPRGLEAPPPLLTAPGFVLELHNVVRPEPEKVQMHSGVQAGRHGRRHADLSILRARRAGARLGPQVDLAEQTGGERSTATGRQLWARLPVAANDIECPHRVIGRRVAVVHRVRRQGQARPALAPSGRGGCELSAAWCGEAAPPTGGHASLVCRQAAPPPRLPLPTHCRLPRRGAGSRRSTRAADAPPGDGEGGG